ncbi:molybdopterin-binding protein [Leisingera aquaemixtae]|uniref:Putative molybdopterin biosynthesis protein MoeA/LysR substrate binding-domain-containing protein n=1 Tax=Leisingera aquaemixtae TaxID=1396826 RepID=A0A0P1HE88_9RHOB|nr:molybdopterin-binding protein [Leisingera aquaemixtae]CUI01995.1 putative molybdopterin biosynthesis protein MoeA/LysR substrate binding-domain-containing protein [Leisingera aquaemixtae]
MRFGPVPLKDAEGAILAHSLQGSSGKVAKGTVLTAEDIKDLAAAGHETLTVARLDPADMHEDAAAETLAKALVPDPSAQGIRISGAGTGRVNLYATGAGLVRLDRGKLEAVNAVDPMITVATVPDYHRADAGGMLATIKIISYGVRADAIRRASSGAGDAIRVLPPVLSSATLIETTVGEDTPPDNLPDKGRAAMAGRLHRMGLSLSARVVVPHREDALAEVITRAPGQLVLILTGSATSDIHDVAPEALRLAGGTMTRFGMPVDPGNLLFLGTCRDKPVIGLPGCARSPALNGADWVLERVICGLPVRSADIAAMGVGGLLKEIPTRPMPRRDAEG